MDSAYDSRFFTVRVSPFGNLRVKAYFQLTAAYRRLSRPSSALGAKAFILCSFSLEQLRSCSLHKLASLPELSQIIVFGCVKLFRLHCFLVPPSIAACRLHCSFPLFSERPSINLSIKKSFVIQLSVSFLFSLFGFQ